MSVTARLCVNNGKNALKQVERKVGYRMVKLTVKRLESLRLDKGEHASRRKGVCVMEAAAWMAGEKNTDAPACVSPVLASFLRSWNDSVDDEFRQKLKPFIARIIGTAGDSKDERRAWMATDWLVRVCAPAWLDLAGLTQYAIALRTADEISSQETAVVIKPGLAAARDAARAAARDAARAAAGAAGRDAAWDAARDAAWDAARAAAWDAARAAGRDAAWYAARDAARFAGRGAAWYAAWDAAWDAARAAGRDAAWYAARDAARFAAADAARATAGAAARDAAWDAAGDAVGDAVGDAAREALRPIVETLQASALQLLDRMVTGV